MNDVSKALLTARSQVIAKIQRLRSCREGSIVLL